MHVCALPILYLHAFAVVDERNYRIFCNEAVDFNVLLLRSGLSMLASDSAYFVNCDRHLLALYYAFSIT